MPVLTNEMLIDDLLPDFDATIIEHVVVNAPPEVVYATAREMDFMQIHSPMTDLAMFARSVPAAIGRVLGNRPAPPPPPAMRLADMFDNGASDAKGLEGWVGLGEAPGREIVFGAVGKFWQLDIDWKPIPAEEFRAFNEPDFAKLAAALSTRPYGDGRTLLSYEARTAGTDDESRRKFLRYWRLVSRFVHYIMRAANRTIKDLAEAERSYADL